jgi:hypothetical protein
VAEPLEEIEISTPFQVCLSHISATSHPREIIVMRMRPTMLTQRITGACGSYRAGWDVVADRAAQYGYETTSVNFCGREV